MTTYFYFGTQGKSKRVAVCLAGKGVVFDFIFDKNFQFSSKIKSKNLFGFFKNQSAKVELVINYLLKLKFSTNEVFKCTHPCGQYAAR